LIENAHKLCPLEVIGRTAEDQAPGQWAALKVRLDHRQFTAR
jgi:hypothetical protein